jgi:hypothetical protein
MRSEFLASVEEHIATGGAHFTFVTQGVCPRYAYSIGMHAKKCHEYIFAGGLYYEFNEMKDTMQAAVQQNVRSGEDLSVGGVGTFSVGRVHHTWIDLMMLGAVDFYANESVSALQILPKETRRTIDVPDMSEPWSAERSLGWKWLRVPWDYPIPPVSVATTNLAALGGAAVTEAARWEDDRWELFAGSGPDTPEKELRVAPLGTFLASDSSLDRILSLRVGQALWRQDRSSDWNEWA